MKSKKPKNLGDIRNAKRDLKFAASEMFFLEHQHPYIAVTVSVAVLEELLKSRIEERLVNSDNELQNSMFGSPQGFATSFSAKIELAFALGVFGVESRTDLHNIRRVRNIMAHNSTIVEFSDPAIVNVCRSLHIVKQKLTSLTIEELPSLKLFCLAVGHLAGGLSKPPIGYEIPPMA